MTSAPQAAAIQAKGADRAAMNAALVLALALPGDAVLYLLLPLYAATFGVTLPEAGVLLAANRIVRIFGYGWVAHIYGTRGARAACLAASAGAIFSTFSYAAFSGVWILLVARLVWGLSFAALNIANQALPTAVMHGAARRSGRARSIVAVGPMVGLMAGAVIAERFGPRPVFFALGCLAALAPLAALQLPSLPEPFERGRPSFSWPSSISIWSFSMGLTLDGIFVFGLSLLASRNGTGTGIGSAVVLAGAAMALRYLSEIVLSPVGGALAHRFGARRLLIGLSFGCAIGLLLIGMPDWIIWAGVLSTVVLRALLQPLPAPVVAETVGGAHRVPALANQATWRDIGAGAGPLVAGLLFNQVPTLAIYAGAACVLAGATLLFARSSTPSANDD